MSQKTSWEFSEFVLLTVDFIVLSAPFPAAGRGWSDKAATAGSSAFWVVAFMFLIELENSRHIQTEQLIKLVAGGAQQKIARLHRALVLISSTWGLGWVWVIKLLKKPTTLY